ncbi:transglycosylase SLT domain-containing protein, partial [Glaciecola punicea]
MKFILPVGLVIALSACSVNPLVIEKEYEDVQDTIGEVNELIIDNLLPCSGELNSSDQNAGHLQDCETQSDGVIKVIHLTQEVDIALEQPDPIDPNTLNDLWEKIQYQMTLPIPQNQPRLDAQKNWYLRHPAYMQRVSKRARPFLYHITQRLEQENMPMELALLPIVESAFDPFAYSHGRASGMWQFIPSTGKRFGMKQTWWYDGRRDVIASTEGAIKYLRYLNDMFDGDWLHALAAYNSGEGRVMRAIKKNKRAGKPTDFWSLDLPRETRAYVPKLLALADILKSQDEYNFSWPKIANAPVVEIVDVSSQIDLAVAARMA